MIGSDLPETKACRRLATMGLLCCLVLLVRDGLAVDAEYLSTDAPPASVEEEKSAFGEGVADTIEEKRRPSLFPNLRKALQAIPRFWREGHLIGNFRTYYLDQNRDDAQDREAWPAGGSLAYQTGWWKQTLRLGANLYTSQKLRGPRDKAGTGLLKPVQNSFTVLGQLYAQIQLGGDVILRAFRQAFHLPYVNANDTRMVPNTFEALTLYRLGVDRLDVVASHITRIKPRDSSKFVSMSQAAGIEGENKGLTLAGARYAFGDGADIGATNQYAWDFMNTFYSEGHAAWTLTDDVAIRFAGQFTSQKSVGQELDGKFDTRVWGAKLSTSYAGAILTVAHTSTADNSGIRSPYGGYPGYASVIVQDFDRAGESAWLIGLSTDFRSLGIKGLSAFANYVDGDTPDSGSKASPDQREIDITVDYRVQQDLLKGLWIRLRHAYVDQEGAGAADVTDNRIIVNYEIPLW